MRAIYTGLVLLAMLAIVETPKAKGYSMATQTRTPNSASSDSSIGGLAWIGLPTNIQADDALNSTLVTGLAYGNPTQYCKSWEFNFDQVPDDAETVSVTFRIKRKNVGQAAAQDAAARVVLGGAIQSTDRSLSGNWPSTAAFAEYVVTGLTPAQVKDAGFGFALAAKNVNPGNEEFKPNASPIVGYVEAVASW